MEAKVVLWTMNIYTVILDVLIGYLLVLFMMLMADFNLHMLPWAVPLLGITIPLPSIEFLYPIPVLCGIVVVEFLKEYRHRNITERLKGQYENLDERLQTALEYQGTHNVIVEDLNADVIKRMDEVETSSFVDMKVLSKRIYVLAVLSFLFLTVTVLNLRSVAFNSLDYILDSTNAKGGLSKVVSDAGTEFEVLTGRRWEASNYSNQKEEEKLGAKSGGDRPGFSEGPTPGKGGGAGTVSGKDIYGEASSASIEGRDVDFRLHPEYGGSIDIKEVGGRARDRNFQMDEVSSAQECVECIVAPENEDVVRRYFEKIGEIS
ncbi:MAG: hypothetical protein V1744_08350 [Candidatus Altiarchaeota archaeon]